METNMDNTARAALYMALAKAQGKMQTPKRSREAKIPGKDGKPGYTYSYADLSEVYEAVRPALASEGLGFFHLTNQDRESVSVTTVLTHEGGGQIETTLAWGVSNRIQDLGSIITYLRRYTLSALLGVASEEDDDGQTAERAGFEKRATAAYEAEKKAKEDRLTDSEVAALEGSFQRLCKSALGRTLTDDEYDLAEMAICESPIAMLDAASARRKAAGFERATETTVRWARERLLKRGIRPVEAE